MACRAELFLFAEKKAKIFMAALFSLDPDKSKI
jgi:hypothetical protein